MKASGNNPFGLDAEPAPAVFGLDDEGAPLAKDASHAESAPVVYLASANTAQTGDDVTFHVYRSDEGELLLPAFSSLEALVTVFGDSQAWIGVNHNRLEPIRTACGAAQVVWDPTPTES